MVISINSNLNDACRSESVGSLSSTIDAAEVAKGVADFDHQPQLKKSSLIKYQFSVVEDEENNTNKNNSNATTSLHFKLHPPLPTNHKQKLTPAQHQQLQTTLSSILILNSPPSNPKVQSLLKSYNGHLMSMGTNLLQGLYNAAPSQLAARVGDYNENLFYQMEHKNMDLSAIIRAASNMKDDDNEKDLIDTSTQSDINNFESSLRNILLLNNNNKMNISYRGSYMSTEHTMYQPAHVDYDYTILQKYGERLFLAFFPLTEEGAFLQLWQDDEKKTKKKKNDSSTATGEERKECEGTVVYIPYGKMLLMPSDTIHGGGFKNGSAGNLRFHLYIALEDEKEDNEDDEGKITLLDHPMNKYTEEHDKRRELCERFVNAKGLDMLLGTFFDIENDEVEVDDDTSHHAAAVEVSIPVPLDQEEEEYDDDDNNIVAMKKHHCGAAVKSVLASTLSGTKLPGSSIVGYVTKRNSASFVNLYGLTEDV